MNILEIKNLSKTFNSKTVINRLNLVIPTGVIYGFVGENGAGKTTTMKMILGLEKSSDGEIFVQGELVKFGHTATNRLIGYLPDVPEFYDYMTAVEYLNFCGQITSLDQSLEKRIAEVLKLVHLTDEKKRIKGYSRGMKQRLGIAQALLNKPKLLICDEPTSALDPLGRSEFLELLFSLKEETTILFSTHILSDVERICDHVGILHDGQLVVDSPTQLLKEQYAKAKIILTFDERADLLAVDKFIKALDSQQQIFSVEKSGKKKQWAISYTGDEEKIMKQVLNTLLFYDLMPICLEKMTTGLEDIFLEVTR